MRNHPRNAVVAGRATLSLVALAALPVASAFAADRRVPEDFPTIQEAVDAAQTGDIVIVAAGRWKENVVLSGKSGIELRGASGAEIFAKKGDGITVTMSDSILVTGFEVTAPKGRCVFLDRCSVLTVSDVTTLRSKKEGIRVEAGSEISIERCAIYDAGTDGIGVSVGSATRTTDIVIRGCTISRPGDDGVDLHVSTGLVEDCFVERAKEDGFETDGSFADHTDITFRNCTADRPARSGFIVVGLRHQIESCSVVRPRGDGAQIYGLNHTVTGLIVENANRDGIFVNGDNCTFTSNTINNPRDDGFQVFDGGHKFTSNTIDSAGGFGFEVKSTGSTYRMNTTTDTRRPLSDRTGGNTYENNSFPAP